MVRYLWDAATESLGIPPCTKGAGDAGVLHWRKTNKENWMRVLKKKPEDLVYNPDLSKVCAIVYDRLVRRMSTEFFKLPKVITVEFEAYALVVYMVTWMTPAAQHSEGTCGSKSFTSMLEKVRKQREIVSGMAQQQGAIEETD